MFHRIWQISLAVVVLTPAAAPAQDRAAHVLRVASNGDGIITSGDGRISCGNDCSGRYRDGDLVTLSVSRGRDFVFNGWTAGCVGTATTCAVSVHRSTTVRAQFTRLTRRVSMTVSGPGAVVSVPGGLDCGTSRGPCAAQFGQGTVITLTAERDGDGAFDSWGGACALSTGDTCRLTVDDELEASAVFRHAVPAQGDLPLTVTSEFARVVSAPGGIDCPPACLAPFQSGTRVTLSSDVVDWGGACAGLSMSCTLVVDSPTSVSARGFPAPPPPPPPPPPRRTVGVNVSVSGPGRVYGGSGSRRPEIRCGRRAALLDCGALFDLNTLVVLRAAPVRRGRFVRWQGFCRGKKRRCALRATAPKTVMAVFRR